MTLNTLNISIPVVGKIQRNISYYLSSSDGIDFEFIHRDGDNILVRVDQRWFWTDEWQDGEQIVDAYINDGNVQSFDTMEDFLGTLQD